jgi:hypothetical protein
MIFMNRSAAEQLANALEAFVMAKMVNERLRNPESELALGKARGALIDSLERE